MLNICNQRTRVRYLSVLALILVGLTGWNTLPLHLSGGAVEAATHTRSLTAETLQSASGTVANGRIAFVSRDVGVVTNAEIYTMNPDGSDRRRLTFDPRQDDEPAWSPDGTKIAFARSGIPGTPRSSQIYVMNADGSDQRQLTEIREDRYYSHPTWSPDGTKIAFQNTGGNGSDGVFVMNADGGDQRKIFQGGFYHPAWSPDGSKLVGSRDGLVLINIDGSNPTQITQPPTPFNPATYFADYDPSWSPDGSKIVFTRFVDCDFFDCYESRLYVINSDGSNLTLLTRQVNLGFPSSPDWSPDGTKIVFGNTTDLYVINLDGSGLTNLTNTNDKSETSPSWQPLSSPPMVNLIDDEQFFVRQHYLDFLNREPDAAGLEFWTQTLQGYLSACGAADNAEANTCRARAKAAVSEAFFVSVEFQETGYLVYRLYESSFPESSARPRGLPRFAEFLADARTIGAGVIVNEGGWEQKLEANKAAFIREFVQRAEFIARYPEAMTAENYVAALLATAGLSQTGAEKQAALAAYGSGGTEGRAGALRSIAESKVMFTKEFNPAFVLMQYFGYLRRNPNEGQDSETGFAGYDFWLRKLDTASGDTTRFNTIEELLAPTRTAQMVEAFVVTGEYRRRFGTD